MKLVFSFVASFLVLGSLHANAASKIGVERTFACAAQESSLIWNITLKHVSSVYAIPGITILLPAPLERGTRYIKSGNVLGLDKRRLFNVEINHVENAQNHNTVSASVAVADVEQGSFVAAVETVVVTQGKETSSVANFSCQLISEQELALGER